MSLVKLAGPKHHEKRNCSSISMVYSWTDCCLWTVRYVSVGGLHYSQSDFSLHYKLCAPYGWPTYKLTCSAYLALVSQDRPTSAEVGLACKTNFSS